MSLGCFVSVGRSLEQAIDRVVLAEELGYDSAWVTHINGAEPFIVLTAYAMRTSKIKVATGVTPIYTSTPAQMAQKAATLGRLSGGRHVLGLGVSHRPIVEAWHGQRIDKPGTEQREYAQAVKAILRGEPAPTGTLKSDTQFALQPDFVQPDLPVYISALSPRMLEIAGEVADGVVLWLCNPHYVRDVVVPHVTIGRERAGKTLEGFGVVAAVPSACVEDPADAKASQRRDLLPYFGLPFYRAMLERSGFGDDIARFDEAAGRGDAEAMQAAIGDDFLDVLCAIGTEEQVRAGVQRYVDAGVTSPCVGPIARTDFDATLRAAAPR